MKWVPVLNGDPWILETYTARRPRDKYLAMLRLKKDIFKGTPGAHFENQ